MQFTFTRKAYWSVVEECRSFPIVETGGILVGKRIGDNFVVPFAIGSGPNAKRSHSRFTPDVEWQQRLLDKLTDLHPVNYLGSFHRHPGFFGVPSHLDYKTAVEITSSPSWGVSEAIFPIIIRNGTNFKIYPYHFSHQSNQFQLIPWQIVSQRDQLVRPLFQRRTT